MSSKYRLDGERLSEAVDHCTCGADHAETGPEPHCGWELVGKVDDLVADAAKVYAVGPIVAAELRRLADQLERDHGHITVEEATAAMRARADELDAQ